MVLSGALGSPPGPKALFLVAPRPLSELSWLCAQQGKLEEASRYQNEAEAIHAALDRDEAPAPAS